MARSVKTRASLVSACNAQPWFCQSGIWPEHLNLHLNPKQLVDYSIVDNRLPSIWIGRVLIRKAPRVLVLFCYVITWSRFCSVKWTEPAMQACCCGPWGILICISPPLSHISPNKYANEVAFHFVGKRLQHLPPGLALH